MRRLDGFDGTTVRRWRRRESLKRTKRLRPELLERAELTGEDRELLEEVEEEEELGQDPSSPGSSG